MPRRLARKLMLSITVIVVIVAAVSVWIDGLSAEDRAGSVVRGGALLVCQAGLGQRNQFPEGRRLAIPDLHFFQEGAGHGDYRSSSFLRSSPPSAMVTPSPGRLKACPSW